MAKWDSNDDAKFLKLSDKQKEEQKWRKLKYWMCLRRSQIKIDDFFVKSF